MKSALLESVRIVDLTRREGWDCGRFLASLGAEVIRVDLPGAETDEAWRVGQADKTCVAIDYEGEGLPLLKELIAGSAMVIESFVPGHHIGGHHRRPAGQGTAAGVQPGRQSGG